MIDPTELKALLDAATPGPWGFERNGYGLGEHAVVTEWGSKHDPQTIICDNESDYPYPVDENNQRLIALAPTLAASYLEVCAERDALREALESAFTHENAWSGGLSKAESAADPIDAGYWRHEGRALADFFAIARQALDHAALLPSKEADDAS